MITFAFMQRSLHIIAFDIPFPANYGGVIVVYYHLKTLAERGLKIILHCFEYGDRQPQEILMQYCTAVYYYPRSRSLKHQLSSLPFIVKTRENAQLLKRLLEDHHPILMEGIHCCAYLKHPALAHRLKLIRMHNIEWQYYRNLAKLEKRLLHKAYFFLESEKLKRFEKENLKYANTILTLTDLDRQYFRKFHTKVINLGPFHGNEHISSKLGKGDYALFHGKLSVEDNEKAAIFLAEKIMSKVGLNFVIAGLEPSEKLKNLLQKFPTIKLVANPSEKQMRDLIQNAQINILLSFQVAGIKLKLLNALYQGRHCLVNSIIMKGTGLDAICEIADSKEELIEKVKYLAKKEFKLEMLEKRKNILVKLYANETAANKTIQLLENQGNFENNHFQ